MNQLIKRLMVQLDAGVDWCIENRKMLAVLGVPGTACFVLLLYAFTGSEFLLFSLGFVLGAIELGAAVGLGLLYFRYDQERKDLRLEVADTLEAFMTGTDAMGDWDAFLAEAVRDRELERIRQRCIALPKDYPPQIPGEYCSAEGMEALLEMVETLRAGIASKFYVEAKTWLTQGRRRYRTWKNERDERTALRMAARAEEFLGFDEEEEEEESTLADEALPAAPRPQNKGPGLPQLQPPMNKAWRPDLGEEQTLRPINVGVSIDPPVLEQMREARKRKKRVVGAKQAARDAVKAAKAIETAQAAEVARLAKAAKRASAPAPAPAPAATEAASEAPPAEPARLLKRSAAPTVSSIQAAIGRRTEAVNFTAPAPARKGMTEAAVIERLMKEGLTAHDFDRMHQELSARGKKDSPAEVYKALTTRRARKERRDTTPVIAKTKVRTKATRRAKHLPVAVAATFEMPRMRHRARLDLRRLQAAFFIVALVALPFAAFRIPEGPPVSITGEIREFSFDSTADLTVMLRSQFETLFGNRGLSFVDGPRIYVSEEDYDRCWADAPVDVGRGYLISVQAEARQLLFGGYEVAEIRKVERIDVDSPTQEAAAPLVVQPTTWHDPIRRQLPRRQGMH